MHKSITIYSKDYCPYCVRAKEFFRQRNIDFQEIDVSDNLELLEDLKKKTRHLTVPQIFIDDNFIGGYTDLIAKVNRGDIKL